MPKAEAEGARSTPTLRLVLEVVGWIGAAIIVVTYFLSMRGQLDAKSTTYQLLNLTGALAICGICWRKKTWQPLAINVLWAGMALHALTAGAA